MHFVRPGYEVRREWLITNGIGGYASSTIIGENTRGYHGLLIAALRPPVQRYLLVSKYEEYVNDIPLSTNRYPDTLYPTGYQYLDTFTTIPFPSWTFRAGGVTVEKTITMVRGRNAVITEYALEDAATLRIFPLLNCRDFHSRTKSEIPFSVAHDASTCRVESPHGITICLGINHGIFTMKPTWYYRMTYSAERERGLDDEEHHFCPGVFTVEGPGRFYLLATGGWRETAMEDFEKLFSENDDVYRFIQEREKRRLSNLVTQFYRVNAIPHDPHLAFLVRAADAFIVKRGEGTSIIAGYPWFADWGRDAMMSVTGLLTFCGRYDEAVEVLRTFAVAIDRGIIPNTFDEYTGKPVYNTIDASLWFFIAVHALARKTGSGAVLRRFLPAMRAIVEGYMKGTWYGIMVQPDGLVSGGPQLTWMDAKVGDRAITPRDGKPVEVNALWYNALCILASAERAIGNERAAAEYEARAHTVREQFGRFWNPSTNYLFDVIDPHDASIRPNAVTTLALPFPILDETRAQKILDRATAELYTPLGLRTLSPADPRYRGRYVGGPVQRDEAYHMGTAWGFLLGHYIIAYARYRATTFSDIQRLFSPVFTHLFDGGIGFVSEIFDGNDNTPRGCIAQAWSVGELIRAYIDAADILRMRAHGP